MIWQLLQVRQLDVPLIFAGPMWRGLVDWTREQMLRPGFELASARDLAIPICVDNAAEAVAVIREHHDELACCATGHGRARSTINLRDMLTKVRPELGGPGPLNVLPLMLEPDPARTVIRPFDFAYPPAFAEERGNRRLIVARRVLDLDEAEQAQIVGRMLAEMRERHRNVEAVFLRRYEELGDDIRRLPVNHAQKLLLGAYFSQEFAFESAALFNPSIVPDPRDIGCRTAIAGLSFRCAELARGISLR